MLETSKFIMAILHWKQGLLCDKRIFLEKWYIIPLLFENRPLFSGERGNFPPHFSVSRIDTASPTHIKNNNLHVHVRYKYEVVCAKNILAASVILYISK